MSVDKAPTGGTTETAPAPAAATTPPAHAPPAAGTRPPDPPGDGTVLLPESAAAASRLDAAMAAFNAARASEEDPPPAPAADPAAAPAAELGTAPVTPPPEAAAQTPPDPRFDEVLKRLSASEQKVREHEQRARAAEQKAAEYEALFSESEVAPEKIFDKIKWDPEKVREYAEKGKRALSPELARLAKQSQTQAEELAQLKQQLEHQKAAVTVASYKAELGRDYVALADKVPHLTAAYDGDQAQIVEQLFATIDAAYNKGQGKLLTTAEAAHAIDGYWERIAKKFAPKSSAPATPTATQSPKPSAATANPTAPPPDDDGDAMSPDERRFAAALAAMRATRRETA